MTVQEPSFKPTHFTPRVQYLNEIQIRCGRFLVKNAPLLLRPSPYGYARQVHLFFIQRVELVKPEPGNGLSLRFRHRHFFNGH